jgi:hypothetical protein
LRVEREAVMRGPCLGAPHPKAHTLKAIGRTELRKS